MQDFLLYSAIPRPGRLCPVPACPADSHCVIVYPPAIQIATLDLLNFIKNESWVPCKMQNGETGAAGFISSLGRDFADRVVIESLALPSLTAPLLRRGSSAAQGDGEHGEPLRFFRRARCSHRAVPGRPGVPPLPMGERSLIPYPARATARVAPTSTCLKPDGRVRTPAPTRHIQKLSFFVGAGPRPARGRGTPQGGVSRPSADSPSAPPLRISRTSSAFG